MAKVILIGNSWFVVHADGRQERCHNRATARLLASRANAGAKV